MYFPRLFLCLQSTGIRSLDGLRSLRWVSFCPVSFTCNSHQGYFFTLGSVSSFSASLGILGLGKRSPWSHLAAVSCFHCCLNSLVSNLLCGSRYETQPLLLESTILLPGGRGAGNCYRRAHAEHISTPPNPLAASCWRCLTAQEHTAPAADRAGQSLPLTQASPHQSPHNRGL